MREGGQHVLKLFQKNAMFYLLQVFLLELEEGGSFSRTVEIETTGEEITHCKTSTR
jgi:hypothetical protein